MLEHARPIWISGKLKEMNTLAAFRTVLTEAGEAELYVTAAYYYRAFLDGKFLGYGPARAAKGYARVDRLCFALDGKPHELVIEAEGFCCESLSVVWEPAYCMAEVLVNGKSVAWTGRDFEVFEPLYHVQKVMRYSGQRHFTEVYDFRRSLSSTDPAGRAEMAVLHRENKLLERAVSYPRYDTVALGAGVGYGKLEHDASEEAMLIEKHDKPLNDNSIRWGNFAPEEIDTKPYIWSLSQKLIPVGGMFDLPVELDENEYALFDLGMVETGFLQARFEALADADVIVAYCEYHEGEQFKIRGGVKNVLEYFANEGQKINTQSFEPYSFRWMLVQVKKGKIRLDGLGIMRFENPVVGVEYPEFGNELRDLIYKAAIRTLAQNSVDIYMDCPSRERAGWLCDSYFTGRVEKKLLGTSTVERAFLENFRLFENRGEIPEGALPMCYPAGFINNNDFIPQWDMWYVLEVEEYLTCRETEVDREIFRASVMGVLDFLSRYENEDGLLERLPSWNFVEWSRANKWTKDVNYPTNFLYARTLLAAYNLYGGEELREKSRRVAAEAKRQSFNGELFTDHAIRGEDGKLYNAGDISEICQYYAILLADLDLQAPEYAKLLDMVKNVFLPTRVATPEFDVEPINAFIGVYLRMDTLLKLGYYEQALAECEDFFGDMARATGTLWENRTPSASCNHGFASYAAVVMMKCVEELKK
ncbi:MAG: hypothetical protein IJW16_02930 [Clostridia bacterium]|nr:hypothetical protein [Clostridia bacterium]